MKKLLLLTCVSMCMACGSDYLPKPKGFNRIDLPEREFEKLEARFPYSFEHSAHSLVESDEFNPNEEAWINLNYKDMEAKVHLTYKPIDGEEEKLKSYLADAINLTSKHQVKAYGIDESILRTPNGYTGVVAELSGEVPTQFQFFVTDSTQHFLRGALYFNVAHKNDSLAPVIEYIKVDMMHLMNTLEFKQ
ncbi:gliding motility lipoprotein GldD [Litoribacter ruber]|uniref:Gliding motility lipoprotein GldD n=1 Tax=Litoribacter ruber TaxID=702568 RepID=A0AAP2G3W4_9BACT|nr:MULTISPECIES: gliding motility lipoprotein GldD [Litoribacter]MBS9523416.1 gliding motility lipoprotein GldD [Litoribacter alkaliphilus]MBT0812458.1 gliding motility lipoprotein GldD [Litoribacter ruber]